MSAGSQRWRRWWLAMATVHLRRFLERSSNRRKSVEEKSWRRRRKSRRRRNTRSSMRSSRRMTKKKIPSLTFNHYTPYLNKSLKHVYLVPSIAHIFTCIYICEHALVHTLHICTSVFACQYTAIYVHTCMLKCTCMYTDYMRMLSDRWIGEPRMALPYTTQQYQLISALFGRKTIPGKITYIYAIVPSNYPRWPSGLYKPTLIKCTPTYRTRYVAQVSSALMRYRPAYMK